MFTHFDTIGLYDRDGRTVRHTSHDGIGLMPTSRGKKVRFTVSIFIERNSRERIRGAETGNMSIQAKTTHKLAT